MAETDLSDRHRTPNRVPIPETPVGRTIRRIFQGIANPLNERARAIASNNRELASGVATQAINEALTRTAGVTNSLLRGSPAPESDFERHVRGLSESDRRDFPPPPPTAQQVQQRVDRLRDQAQAQILNRDRQSLADPRQPLSLGQSRVPPLSQYTLDAQDRIRQRLATMPLQIGDFGNTQRADIDEASFWARTAQVVGMGVVESEAEFRQNLFLMEQEAEILAAEAEQMMELFGADAAAQYAPQIQELNDRIARARQAIDTFDAAVGKHIATTSPLFDDAVEALGTMAELSTEAANRSRATVETRLHAAEEAATAGLTDVLDAIGADNPALREDVAQTTEDLFLLATTDLEAKGVREDRIYEKMEEAAKTSLEYAKAQNILDARIDQQEVTDRLNSSIERMIDQRSKLSAQQSQAVARAKAAAAGSLAAQRNFDADSWGAEAMFRWLNNQSGFTSEEIIQAYDAFKDLRATHGVNSLNDFKLFLGQQGGLAAQQQRNAVIDLWDQHYGAATTGLASLKTAYEQALTFQGPQRSERLSTIQTQWRALTGLGEEDLRQWVASGVTFSGLDDNQLINSVFLAQFGFRPAFNPLDPDAGITHLVDSRGRVIEDVTGTLGDLLASNNLALLETLVGAPIGIDQTTFKTIMGPQAALSDDLRDALTHMYSQYDMGRRDWETRVKNRNNQTQFRPFSADLSTLIYDAYNHAFSDPEAAQQWARSGALHEIVQRESGGVVGVINRRAAQRHGLSANDIDAWIKTVSNGTLQNTAYGLGQLKGYHWETFAPEFGGIRAIGNPLAEMVAMLRYLRGRYGTPERALEEWLQKGWY